MNPPNTIASDTLVEAIARAMWDDRERTFPPFTRMTWENGTDIARETTIGYVAAVARALEALGYAVVPIEPTEAMLEAGYASLEAMDLFDEGACTVVTACRAMIHATNTGKAE